ncbi:MAG: 3-deoxy-D-manno-octulosonic acid transferase [Planctomycetota bacterium]|jgi:3-deoxy-D-manno-octulosonic-acid transferase
MRILIDCVYLLGAVALSPMVVYRMVRHERYRTGWKQRLGRIARRRPEKKSIWLHAVSLGEVNATNTIVAKLEKKFPDFEIVISTTTDTGFARAHALFAKTHTVTYFPFDLSWIMGRAFHNIDPAICLLMELEVWPNLVQIAHRLNVPVVIVNGRITERSFARYGKIRAISKRVFQKVSLVLAQTEEYAGRFRRIGCPAEKVIVTSSLKYDTAQVADKVEGADLMAEQLNIGGERLWIAGGTGNDEEKILLDVYKALKQEVRFADLRLAIVPRKPERFDEVARLIADAGFEFLRYSSIKNTNVPTPGKTPVILGDTLGDLRKFYCLATIIFVGRSLVPMGGSDMIEAAALGKCTIFGPHTFNFSQTVEDLLKGRGAVLVKDRQELLDAMQKCLTETDFARQIARNGQNIIAKNQGATEKTIQQITQLLTLT